MKTFLLYSLLLIALGITSCTSTKGKNDLPEAIPHIRLRFVKD